MDLMEIYYVNMLALQEKTELYMPLSQLVLYLGGKIILDTYTSQGNKIQLDLNVRSNIIKFQTTGYSNCEMGKVILTITKPIKRALSQYTKI